MVLGLDTLTFEFADPVRVETFWANALGFDLADADPEGNELSVLRGPEDGWLPDEQ